MAYTAVTTPSVITGVPASSEAAPVPWISAIVAGTGSTGSPGSSGSPGSPGSGSSAPDGVGVGAPAVKSVEFSPVAATRETEVALVVAGAGASPEKVAASPQPRRSTTAGSSAQVAPVQASFPSAFDSAKTPPVPKALMPAVRSAPGSGSPLPLPAASCTRKVPPAGTLPCSARVLWKAPVLEAYCRDQPSMLRSWSVVLRSSTKSFWKLAPELPPPP